MQVSDSDIESCFIFHLSTSDPTCETSVSKSCDLGMFREISLTIYAIIGYPLFALLLSQFAALIVRKTIREQEIRILNSPLTEKEYDYAANLYGNDEV
jgi:hypothetical protein